MSTENNCHTPRLAVEEFLPLLTAMERKADEVMLHITRYGKAEQPVVRFAQQLREAITKAFPNATLPAPARCAERIAQERYEDTARHVGISFMPDWCDLPDAIRDRWIKEQREQMNAPPPVLVGP